MHRHVRQRPRQRPLGHRRQNHGNATGQPKPVPPGSRQPGQHQHDGHAMQHAKIDEAAREHGIGPRRDQQRARCNLHPAPPEAMPVLPLVQCGCLPHSRTKQKQTHDGSALHDPERVVAEILRPMAEMTQVEAEMEDGHPHHRQATKGINSIKTHAARYRLTRK